MDRLLQVSRAQVVGKVRPGVWAQSFYLFPQTEEQREKKGEAFGVIDITASPIFDSASCGREAILAINDAYFGSESGGIGASLREVVSLCKQRVENTALKVTGEAGFDFDLVVGVLWGEVLYLARLGGGAVFLKRGEKLGFLLGNENGNESMGVEMTSGVVKDGDFLVLGTPGFFKVVTIDMLKASFDNISPPEVSDAITPVVMACPDSAAVASSFVHFGLPQVPSVEEEAISFSEPRTGIPRPSFLTSLRSTSRLLFERVTGFLRHAFSRLKPPLFLGMSKINIFFQKLFSPRKPTFYIRSDERSQKRKKFVFWLATFFIIAFGVSVFVSGRNKEIGKKQTRFQEAEGRAERQLSEAKGLLNLNPVRTRALLTDARRSGEEAKSYCGKPGSKDCKDAEAFLISVDLLSDEALKVRRVTLSYFFDLALLKEGALGVSMAKNDGRLVIFDASRRFVAAVDRKTKQAEILGGGDLLSGGSFLASHGDAFFVFTENGIYGVRNKEEKLRKVIDKDLSWGEIAKIISYGGNLYLLDKKNGKIWKYISTETGYSTIREYLSPDTSPDFSKVVSFAVDGSVWVLLESADVLKFTSGRMDAFSLENTGDPISFPSAIYTDENANNVYILEGSKNRVLVFDKKGAYLGQYVWSSGPTPGITQEAASGLRSPVPDAKQSLLVSDMVVSEEDKKVFLLSEGKIYALSLQ